MGNSKKEIRDVLDRGTKEFKTVVVLEEEKLLFTNEDITILGRKLNSSGRFVDLEDTFLNKSVILEVLPMELFLKEREVAQEKQEQVIKDRSKGRK